MEDKHVEALKEVITNAVSKLDAPLRALAVVKLADEFYKKEFRLELVETYSKLLDEVRIAEAAHKAAAGSRGAYLRELRIKREGQETLTAEELARAAERDRLWTIVESLYEKIKVMRKQHPLIQEIVLARDMLCARDHMNRLL